MHWPQITMIALFAAGTAVSVIKHGEPQGPQNAWSSLIAIGVEIGLLIAGGFFNQA